MTYYKLYQSVTSEVSRLVTRRYSSSFSRSIVFLEPEIRKHTYHIYGFVRLADEIVDTFHKFNKRELLDRFVEDYKFALEHGISTNPVLHSFVQTKQKYNIPDHLVDSFIKSMYMDLGDMTTLDQKQYNNYIYGSAEVVGLMCLCVFLYGDADKFEELKPYAQSLGAALQKVNFLRDFQADHEELHRTYFPNVDFDNFTKEDKLKIEEDIAQDFDYAFKGLVQLPLTSRFAVYLAYRYYRRLFNKIRKSDNMAIFQSRIRVNNFEKSLLFFKIMIYKQFKLSSYLH